MFQIETSGRDVRLRVHADLDDENLAQLEALLGAVALDDVCRFDIDLTRCSFISSVVISSFVRLSRRYCDDFTVTIRPEGAVYRVFDLCGFISNETFVRVRRDAAGAAGRPAFAR